MAACRDAERGDGGANPVDPDRTLPADTREFLRAATTFEIVAVHPAWATASAKPEGVTEIMHGHGVLGRAPIEAASERSAVVDLIDKAIGSSDGAVAGCFNPRHGVSALRGSDRMDILICFECGSMRVHTAAEKPDSHLIGRAGEAEMTELFRKHGLTISST